MKTTPALTPTPRPLPASPAPGRARRAPHTTRVTQHHTRWGDGGEWDKAYAYFDRAWGGVLANQRQRLEQGPLGWKPWLQQLEQARTTAAGAPLPAASK